MAWEILIIAIAGGLSLISLFFRVLMHDREGMKEIEFAVIRKQREVKKYQKEKDTKAMMAAQKEMMSMSMKKMKMGFRSTLVTLPLFLIVWWMFLGPMLTVGPMYAGETSQIGVALRNLDASPQDLNVIFTSNGAVANEAMKNVTLDDKGDQGDYEVLWWDVTGTEGQQDYTIRLDSDDKTDEVTYNVRFVSPGALTADFSPKGMEKALGDTIEVTPVYRTTQVNLFGTKLDWNWYYIIAFMILMPIMYPLSNRLLWGHHKGVKHLEKMDRENNEKSD